MMEGRSDEFILSELWDTVICLDELIAMNVGIYGESAEW